MIQISFGFSEKLKFIIIQFEMLQETFLTQKVPGGKAEVEIF